MARYNPNNKQHRKNLAKRIAKMLLSSGFSLEGNTRGEDVYVRAVTPVAKGTAQVRVLTSILNGEMRLKDKDAIRVCAVYTDDAGQSRVLVKSTRINRTGDTDGITGRLLEATRKTYKIAQKPANDQGFLALPVKPSKKPAAMPTYPTFKVGDLVVGLGLRPAPHDRRIRGRGGVKGLVKAIEVRSWTDPSHEIDGPVVTVFWFDVMRAHPGRARFLKHVTA